MRKVFKNCYEMDRRCYEAYGLTEDILMEHAAEGMESYIRHNLKGRSSILIVSGPGNNGADGIALARLMQFAFSSVKLFIPFGAVSVMAQRQLERVKKLEYVEIVECVCEADIIVDALFGAGLSRPLEERAQDIVDSMNDLNGFKIACDIPTGIEESGKISTVVFDADVTITMGARKECLHADVVKDVVGKIKRVDLGLRYNYYTKDMPVASYLLDRDDMELPSRDFSQVTHKGSFGHAVIFCGDKEGASIIAGMSASRFGTGLTTLVSHERITPPPYLMTATEVPTNATAMAIGMGLGHYLGSDFLQKSVVESHLPVVLDADSFYHTELLAILEQKEREIVLTPHPKEFTVLWKAITGEVLSVDEVQESRFEMVRQFNALYPHITLLLKGANMLIAQEDKLYINPFGSAKLSKGGSGDVLSGLIVAQLAQGYTAIDAALQGSLVLTAAAERYSGASYAMLPMDLIDQIEQLEPKA
jgi:hydroxyethylthiazole kinase-like uncharacterized protein yjeF